MQLILDTVILYLPRIGAAVLILIIFLIAGRILGRLANRFGNNRRLSPDIVQLMGQLSGIAMLIFGIVSALGTLGVDIGAIIAGLGLVGFAVGFALKDLLSNFLAGFLVLVYNPFVRGDHITVGAHAGRVVEVNMRYTVLNSDNKKILIPNSILFSNAVIVERQVPAPSGGIDIGK